MGKTETAVPVCSCPETVCSSSEAAIPVCSSPETVCSSPETVCSCPTVPAVSPPQRRLSARLCQLSRSEPLHQPSRLLPRRAVLRPAAQPAFRQPASTFLPQQPQQQQPNPAFQFQQRSQAQQQPLQPAFATQTFNQPQQTFSQPQETFRQPQQTFRQPQQTFRQPQQTQPATLNDFQGQLSLNRFDT